MLKTGVEGLERTEEGLEAAEMVEWGNEMSRTLWTEWGKREMVMKGSSGESERWKERRRRI